MADQIAAASGKHQPSGLSAQVERLTADVDKLSTAMEALSVQIEQLGKHNRPQSNKFCGRPKSRDRSGLC